jgi:hypothetical protein
MNELLTKNKGSLCVHPLLSPPHSVETENPPTQLSAAIVRVNQILFTRALRPLIPSFKRRIPYFFFTIEWIFQKGLFGHSFIQIHSYQLIFKR